MHMKISFILPLVGPNCDTTGQNTTWSLWHPSDGAEGTVAGKGRSWTRTTDGSPSVWK